MVENLNQDWDDQDQLIDINFNMKTQIITNDL